MENLRRRPQRSFTCNHEYNEDDLCWERFGQQSSHTYSLTVPSTAPGRVYGNHDKDDDDSIVKQEAKRQEYSSYSSSFRGRGCSTATLQTHYFSHVLVLLLCVGSLPRVSSQQQQVVGVELCACQPLTYEFKLDFNLTCAGLTVFGGEFGVNASACAITTERDKKVTDLTPVVVHQIQVMVLNQELDVIETTPYNGEYNNGDTFQYTTPIQSTRSSSSSDSSSSTGSFDFKKVMTDNDVIRPIDVPRALQMTIAGRNKEEEELVNFWIVIFDNSCDVYPVLREGQQIGWSTFNKLEPPPEDLCPLAYSQTTAPSPPPNNAPPGVIPPTESPPNDSGPSAAPGDEIPNEPGPTVPPSLRPISAPTPIGAEKPTRRPSNYVKPTCPPVTMVPKGKGKGKGKGGGSYLSKISSKTFAQPCPEKKRS